MKYIIIFGALLCLLLSWFASSVGLKADENDTAYSTNILPNAGVTSSSQDNFNLDGVSTSAASLTNNSTHQGFTITCETEINNACGAAFNGELESSRDMKVSASGSLIFNLFNSNITHITKKTTFRKRKTPPIKYKSIY